MISDPLNQESSPQKTYRTMAFMAIMVAALIGVAIFAFSKMNNPPTLESGEPRLKAPTITNTLRQDLPHFEYADQGKALKTENFEGHWTLLTFWASWCEPCLDEMPALDQLSQNWQGPEFQVVTVNVDEPGQDLDNAKKFLSDQNLVLPSLFDSKGILKSAFKVNELPRHFLINPQMKIVWQEKGAFAWNDQKTRDQLMKVMEEATEATEIKDVPGPQDSNLNPTPSSPSPTTK